MEFTNNFTEIRKSKKITLKHISEKTGISTGRLSKVDKQKDMSNLTYGEVISIANELCVHAEQLFPLKKGL